MDDRKLEHTEHIHCVDCGCCMDIPIPVIIDSILEARADDEPLIGFMCELCLADVT